MYRISNAPQAICWRCGIETAAFALSRKRGRLALARAWLVTCGAWVFRPDSAACETILSEYDGVKPDGVQPHRCSAATMRRYPRPGWTTSRLANRSRNTPRAVLRTASPLTSFISRGRGRAGGRESAAPLRMCFRVGWAADRSFISTGPAAGPRAIRHRRCDRWKPGIEHARATGRSGMNCDRPTNTATAPIHRAGLVKPSSWRLLLIHPTFAPFKYFADSSCSGDTLCQPTTTIAVCSSADRRTTPALRDLARRAALCGDDHAAPHRTSGVAVLQCAWYDRLRRYTLWKTQYQTMVVFVFCSTAAMSPADAD